MRCCDITEWDKIRKVVQEVCPIDLLVNNAGRIIVGPALDVTEQDLDKLVYNNIIDLGINIVQSATESGIEMYAILSIF